MHIQIYTLYTYKEKVGIVGYIGAALSHSQWQPWMGRLSSDQSFTMTAFDGNPDSTFDFYLVHGPFIMGMFCIFVNEVFQLLRNCNATIKIKEKSMVFYRIHRQMYYIYSQLSNTQIPFNS